MRIDAHQHYWKIARGDYDWMGPPVAPIIRDYLPADLQPHLKAAGIEKTVLVQAAATLAETEFMLELAEREASIGGVVGWIDLDAPDAPAVLKRLAGHQKFRGIRPMLQDIDDTFFILAEHRVAVLEALPSLGLTFDALVQPRHLPVIAALADRLPELKIVVDHGAKPFIAKGVIEPWASDMAALAQRPNVFAKISGLLTEAGADRSAAALKPYVDTLLSAFGPERLMFGSDWPVVELATTYDDWWRVANELTAGLSEAGREAILGGTAARFYRI
ncbi:amidohydrolase family protein [Mesorhizobium sp. YR577]|uniref:amidohydrolase family protein n=1 Tax=Mesorhizobium sp. YR577 TaxID=1884373 RepID=UPI0008EB1070|nr:L-fuconolactonase [Mesorhizobium sp. YR577]